MMIDGQGGGHSSPVWESSCLAEESWRPSSRVYSLCDLVLHLPVTGFPQSRRVDGESSVLRSSRQVGRHGHHQLLDGVLWRHHMGARDSGRRGHRLPSGTCGNFQVFSKSTTEWPSLSPPFQIPNKQLTAVVQSYAPWLLWGTSALQRNAAFHTLCFWKTSPGDRSSEGTDFLIGSDECTAMTWLPMENKQSYSTIRKDEFSW